MRPALETIGFALAVVAVVAVVLSAIRNVVLPRAAQSLIPRLIVRSVRAVFRVRARRAATYEDRDRIMAMLAPISLVLLLVSWLLILLVSYSVMFFCLGRWSIGGAIRLSGSSLVTLGSVSDHRFWPSVLTYTEAGLGLLLVALFITYFP
ncbi:MAG TPA: hypothetical protein VKI19_01940, partial [Acidimicrobiales bacterium]|nr:hypothetical protein [Acidimicrobiales bacterium]